MTLAGETRKQGTCPSRALVMVSSMADNRMISQALSAGAAGFGPKHSPRRAFQKALKTISAGPGSMPLFAGSAGDGSRFAHTYLSLNGQVMENAGIVSVIRSTCPIRVFSVNHLSRTETKMVVTDANPRNRIARQINAEPAAQQYARIAELLKLPMNRVRLGARFGTLIGHRPQDFTLSQGVSRKRLLDWAARRTRAGQADRRIRA